MLVTLILLSTAQADDPCDGVCPPVQELVQVVEASAPVTSHRPTEEGKLQDVFDANQVRIDAGVAYALSENQKWDLKQFYKVWTANKATYETVASATNVPALLIAALHYRESSGDFTTYLHQGDPLGAAAVNEPSDIPLFQADEWDKAAIHAISLKERSRADLGITTTTTDMTALATFAERYNGFGYYNHGTASAYVFAGSSAYTGGKYVADHEFSETAVDGQLGVYAMVTYAGEQDAGTESTAMTSSPPAATATPTTQAVAATPAAEPAPTRKRGLGRLFQRKKRR